MSIYSPAERLGRRARLLGEVAMGITVGLLLAAAFLTASLPAKADSWSTSCNRTRGAFNCSTIYSGPVSSEPHIIHVVPHADDAEREARIRKWEAECKPTPVRGKYGVTYLQYAHAGCEFGSAELNSDN